MEDFELSVVPPVIKTHARSSSFLFHPFDTPCYCLSLDMKGKSTRLTLPATESIGRARTRY